jgi:hypothetical protein
MKHFWLVNLILFQGAWFSAALYNAQAEVMIILLLAVHFWLSPQKKTDLTSLLLVPIGVLADKLLMLSGVFDGGQTLFPLWLVLLWCMFILSLSHSLHWVTKLRLPWQVLFGSLGGSASYWAGIQAGALDSELTSFWLLLSLGLVWALLLPLIIRGYRSLLSKQVQTSP